MGTFSAGTSAIIRLPGPVIGSVGRSCAGDPGMWGCGSASSEGGERAAGGRPGLPLSPEEKVVSGESRRFIFWNDRVVVADDSGKKLGLPGGALPGSYREPLV